MNKFILIVGFSVFFTGCSSVSSTGVQQIGKDKYTVSTSIKGITMATEENSGTTRSEAISNANEYCSTEGYNYANVIEESVERGRTATAIITFNCAK